MNYSKVKQLEDVTFSDKVVVSDPCYERTTWCRGELQVTPGIYETKLYYSDEGQWGERVAKLGVYRKGAGETVSSKQADFSVGVDSGQAGIFCDTIYPYGETGDYGNEDSFYRKVCDLTLGEGYEDRRERAERKHSLKEINTVPLPEWIRPENVEHVRRYCEERLAQPEVPYWQGGTLDGKGVVSSSGYGDGGYECTIGTDADGNTTYVEIEFIRDSDEEDENG